MIINHIIRDIMDRDNLSIKDVSRLTGFSEDHIFDIVFNYSSVSPCESLFICSVLGINLETLLRCY